MTNPTPHGQVPEALIDLIDAYAETRHRCGGVYNAKTEAARKAVIEALSGMQALSAAPAIKPLVWSDERGHTDKIRYITAETAAGQFSVEWKGWKEEDGPCVYLNGDYIGVASNLGGAKQLAEQHIRELVANLLAASPTPPAEQQSAPKAAQAIGDELRDTLVAVSAAIAERDDRAAQKMICEILAASNNPPAEQQVTKETSGGLPVWRDISTAPKNGSIFVATGHNYGLYSEVRHTCVAQWFQGCWIEASDWNETSELKYLTHWMPLPSPPDDVAAPAEQQAGEAAESVPAREHDLQDVRCECCGYMTYHREHMGCIHAARAPADSVQEDAARLDWLEQNLFHREKDEWDTKYGGYKEYNMWVLFSPKGIQGSARNIIDAAREQGADHDR